MIRPVLNIVIPAKAGTHLPDVPIGERTRWAPAFAGVTVR